MAASSRFCCITLSILFALVSFYRHQTSLLNHINYTSWPQVIPIHTIRRHFANGISTNNTRPSNTFNGKGGNLSNEKTEGYEENSEYVPDWTTVEEDILYIYSAHLDPRQDTAMVKVFGTLHRDHLHQPVKCQLWIRGSMSEIVESKVITHYMEYAVFQGIDFECLFSGMDPWNFPMDSSVSIMTGNSTEVRIHIEQNFKRLQSRNFTVCLWSPLHTRDSNWFVEWVETNLMFGADIIYVYNFNVSPNVLSIMKYYEDLEKMKILPWTLPPLKGDVNIYIQLTMIADCQYRNINQTRYLVGVDFDELIVPRGNISTWQEMIGRSKCSNSTAFVARQMLYQLQAAKAIDQLCHAAKPCDEKSCNLSMAENSAQFLKTMCFTQRAEGILPSGHRTKYIASPANFNRLNIHGPGDHHQNVCTMGLNVGTLHHYRRKALTWMAASNASMYDNYMHIFWEKLSQRINRTKNHIMRYLAH